MKIKVIKKRATQANAKTEIAPKRQTIAQTVNAWITEFRDNKEREAAKLSAAFGIN